MASQSTPRRKRKSFWHSMLGRALIYFVMTVAVVVIVSALVLVIRGYRYNSQNGELIQGGLLQYDSRPNGADVYLNETKLANRSPNKVTITSGEHVISMKKEGYEDWSKRVKVNPGGILWLNYTRLVPKNKETDPVANYKTVADALPSPDRKTIAIIGDASAAEVSVATLDTTTPRLKKVPIAAESLTAFEPQNEQQFSLMAWDEDSRYVLVKRAFGDKQEWLVVDLRGDSAPLNITTSIGVDIQHAEFKLDNNRVILAQTVSGELRRLNLNDRSMSGPIVSRIAEFAQYDASTVTYVTKLDDQTKQRTVGYYTEGAAKPRVLKWYADHGETPLHLRIGKYYGETYVAIAYGETLDISTGELLSSGSKEASALKPVATLTIPSGVSNLGFSSRDARFLYAENVSSVATYDLELGTFSTLSLDNGDSKGVTWVDREHFVTTKGGAALYDYDGTNKRQITTDSLDITAVISANNKYFYSFSKTDEGAALVRTKLTIE